MKEPMKIMLAPSLVSAALGTNPSAWFEMQTDFDFWQTKRMEAK